MFKLTPLALLLALLLCGFGPGGDPDKEGDKEGEEKEPAAEAKDSRMDASDSTIDMYKDGTMKAMYWVSVHADPKAGQYWETSTEAYGTKFTNRWQVASVDGSTAVVENQSTMSSEYAKSDYVIAYKIDTKVEMGEVNVLKAWVGKPGKDATEIKIMEKPEPVEDGATVDYEVVEEDFKDLEIAGAKWSGKKITVSGDGWESTTWTADNGWFGGVVKTGAGEMVTELKAFGEDAKSLLKLPKEEAEEKKDAPKDEGKEEDKGSKKSD